MKKIFTLLLFSCLCVAGLQAQVLNDDFSGYTTGSSISGQTPWTNNSSSYGFGATTPFMPVASSTMTYPGYGSASKAIQFTAGDSPGRNYTNQSGGTVYTAFLINVANTVTSAATNGRVMYQCGSGTGVSNIANRFYCHTKSGSNLTMSVSKDGGTYADVASVSVGVTHLVVIKHTFNSGSTSDDEVKIIIDPTAGAAEPVSGSKVASTTTGADGSTSLERFVMYGGFGAGASGQLSAIRISTTWAGLFPTCFAPNSIVTSNVSFTTADLSWTAPTGGATPASYDYEVNTSNAYTAGTIVTSGSAATPSSIPLTGLTPNTTYYARVRTNCGGGDLSSYVTTSFTTPPTCKLPTSVAIGTTTAFTSSATWTQVVGSQTEPTSWDYEMVLSPAAYTGSPATPSGVTPTPTGLSAPAVALAGLTSSSTYGIKVRANCGASGYSAWTAGNSIYTAASCTSPYSLAASSITGATATIDWTQLTGNASGDPTMWEYEISSTGTFTNTATGTTTKPLNLMGLSGSSTYYVQLRALCGASDKSGWSASTNFSTPCAAVNINSTPYTTGFESPTAVGNLPTCWSKVLVTTGSTNAATVAAAGFAYPNGSPIVGTQCLKLNYTSSTQRVILPTFDASGLSAVEVSFFASEDNYGSTYDDNITVQYSTNGSVWNNVSQIKRYSAGAAGTATWTKRYFLLPPAAISATLQVALLHAGSGSSGNAMYVDDVKVGAITPVADPNDDACTTSFVTAINGTSWTRVLSGGGVVAEINANGNTLTTVAVKLRDYPAGAANVPSVSGAKLLPHIISIKPQGTISAAVGVRLYFNDAELADYNTAAGLSKTISQLGISKKSETIDNCSLTDNSSTGGVSITPTAVDYGTGFYLEFSTLTFSEFAAVEAGVILAAELTNFTAKKSGDYNQIAWATASEKNVSNFVVERSVDGQSSWTSIGSVKAFGTSTAEKSYSFNDVLPTNTAYYRLVTNDNDGKAATSKTVSVVRPTKYLTVQSIAPNPTTEGVNIDASVNKTSNINVVVTDVLGKVVKAQTFSASEGNNTMRLNLSNLAHGTYIFTINDGETIITKRVVKQ